MANTNVRKITLDGTGTEIPTLSVSALYTSYLITGTVTATGNYAITATGTPQLGTRFLFDYEATLDITTNGTTFSLFGTSITQAQLLKTWTLEAVYNGTTWDTNLLMDFSETQMVSTDNLTDLSVTTGKINNLAVTSTKLAADSVITSKILDLNVTTAKINDLAVTTGKINDLGVTTAKLAANSVTNTKLAQMADMTVKGNVSGGTADPQDLSLISPSGIAAYFWTVDGNRGTVAGTNFIGTLDGVDLVFKTNNTEVARFKGNGSQNLSIGKGALINVTTANSNTAIGYEALNQVVGGGSNIGLGVFSLNSVSTGIGNIGIGNSAGTSITTGQYNTIIGSGADTDVAASNRIGLGYLAYPTVDNSFYIPSSITTVNFTGAVITNSGLAISTKSINTTAGDSATINSVAGRFRKDTSGTTFTLTNSYITANSIIVLTNTTAGITTGNQLSVVAGSGSAVITFETDGVATAPSANMDVNFWVIN